MLDRLGSRTRHALLVALFAGVLVVVARPGARTPPLPTEQEQDRVLPLLAGPEFQEIHDRLVRKERIGRRVLEGELSLKEAAACFRDFATRSAYFDWTAFRHRQENATDEQRFCREVVSWVSAELSFHPTPRNHAACALLEEELCRILEERELHLPDAPDLPEE